VVKVALILCTVWIVHCWGISPCSQAAVGEQAICTLASDVEVFRQLDVVVVPSCCRRTSSLHLGLRC